MSKTKRENVVIAATISEVRRRSEQGYKPCQIEGCHCMWLRGGVVEPGFLCPRHYHRRRRESPNAGLAGSIERRDAFTIRPLPELAELIRKEQRKLKGSVSDAVNALLAELLARRSVSRS